MEHWALSKLQGTTTMKTIIFRLEKVLMELNSKLKESYLI
jgi:hypothetical protein